MINEKTVSICHWNWTQRVSSTTTTTIMATSTSKVLPSLSCRLQFLSQTKLSKLSSSLSPSVPRFSRISRLPVELGSTMGSNSMIPLHSAVASARLVSSLCFESMGWCLVPQGISMPL